MTWFERFGKWFRYELSDFDFIWNILMMASTRGAWFFLMMIYFGIKCHVEKRHHEKFVKKLNELWPDDCEDTVRHAGEDVDRDLGKDEGPDA